jgi:hypothetical protein
MNLPVRSLRHRIIPASEVRERAGVLSVFSSQSRQGDWTVPRELRVAAVLGSVELDLREARLPEGEMRIHIFALLGSVELLLPPGVRIEVEADGLAASVDILPDTTVPLPPDAPTVRVTGGAYLASVEGRVRFAGESEREAKKRLKAASRG